MSNQNNSNPDTHKNWMAGTSFDVNNPLTRLKMAAASSFFGEPQFYHEDGNYVRPSGRKASGGSGLRKAQMQELRATLNAQDPQEWRDLSPTKLMEKAIDDALDFDVEATLQIAADLRQTENVRTTPQIILVRAANHDEARGTGLVRKYAKEIISRGDEPSVGLAYQIAVFGRKKIPNSLKKAWKDALERFDDYQLAKYRQENKVVKTVDVVNLTHPKSDSVDKLVNDELRTTGRTWEAIVSEKGSSKESWEESMEVMGHMASMRNIRNFLQNGIEPSKIADKILEGADRSRMIPFRYFSAYKAVEKEAPPQVLDAIEEAMYKSLGNLPDFEGKTISLCDNSGSARGAFTSRMGTMQVANIANLSGVLTGMVSDEGYVGVFGDDLKIEPIRKRSSILDQLKKMDRLGKDVGQSTENGIWMFFDQALQNEEHYDRIFIYSDMQAGHGGLYGNPSQYKKYQWSGGSSYRPHIDVAKLVKEYREKVNPDVFVYMVQVAGYQDALVPEFYDRTYILGGWSDSILRFADKMEKSHQ